MNYEELLKNITLEDGRFVVMTAENRAVIRNLPEVLGERFIDTGITEQTLVGSAAGLALRGRVPVVHALAAFLTMRSFEFVRTDVGFPCLPVKLVGFVPGFLSEANGPTHQAIEDVSLMRGIPSMNVFCPADEDDLLKGLPSILHSPSPCYIRLNYRQARIEHDFAFEIGEAEWVARGSDVTILTYGTLFGEASGARDILEDRGYSAGLVNMRTLSPVDEDAILRAAEESSWLVTVEDHFNTGGLFSIVAEVFLRNGVMKPVMPLGLESRWFKPALLPTLLEYEGFSPEQIATRIIDRCFK